MYNNKQKLCIILSSLELCSSAKSLELIEILHSYKYFIDGVEDNKAQILSFLSTQQYQRLSLAVTDDYFDSVLRMLTNNKTTIITYFCDNYPKKLSNITEPPLVLYCKGNIDLLNTMSIAVVGSRKNSTYGRKVCEYFVKNLANNNLTIISGLATGIDEIAHSTTLYNNGNTIAVLASGFNCIYPSEHNHLADKIVQNGLLISEHLPNVESTKYNFPKRNRIVSGLSDALLVVEAAAKSGVFSTVDHALEQGKELFVVPGDIFNINSIGSNDIIKRMQGAVVTNPSDITDALNLKYQSIAKNKAIQLSIEQQSIVDFLKLGNKHFNEIANSCKIDLKTLNFTLAQMELDGFITKLPQNYYMLNMEAIN